MGAGVGLKASTIDDFHPSSGTVNGPSMYPPAGRRLGVDFADVYIVTLVLLEDGFLLVERGVVLLECGFAIVLGGVVMYVSFVYFADVYVIMLLLLEDGFLLVGILLECGFAVILGGVVTCVVFAELPFS